MNNQTISCAVSQASDIFRHPAKALKYSISKLDINTFMYEKILLLFKQLRHLLPILILLGNLLLIDLYNILRFVLTIVLIVVSVSFARSLQPRYTIFHKRTLRDAKVKTVTNKYIQQSTSHKKELPHGEDSNNFDDTSIQYEDDRDDSSMFGQYSPSSNEMNNNCNKTVDFAKRSKFHEFYCKFMKLSNRIDMKCPYMLSEDDLKSVATNLSWKYTRPDIETLNWLDKTIETLWPTIKSMIEEELIKPVLKMKFGYNIKVTRITIGDSKPKINAIKLIDNEEQIAQNRGGDGSKYGKESQYTGSTSVNNHKINQELNKRSTLIDGSQNYEDYNPDLLSFSGIIHKTDQQSVTTSTNLTEVSDNTLRFQFEAEYDSTSVDDNHFCVVIKSIPLLGSIELEKFRVKLRLEVCINHAKVKNEATFPALNYIQMNILELPDFDWKIKRPDNFDVIEDKLPEDGHKEKDDGEDNKNTRSNIGKLFGSSKSKKIGTKTSINQLTIRQTKPNDNVSVVQQTRKTSEPHNNANLRFVKMKGAEFWRPTTPNAKVEPDNESILKKTYSAGHENDPSKRYKLVLLKNSILPSIRPIETTVKKLAASKRHSRRSKMYVATKSLTSATLSLHDFEWLNDKGQSNKNSAFKTFIINIALRIIKKVDLIAVINNEYFKFLTFCCLNLLHKWFKPFNYKIAPMIYIKG